MKKHIRKFLNDLLEAVAIRNTCLIHEKKKKRKKYGVLTDAKSDYRKGISRGRVTSALDRKLHRVQLRIRGPRRVLAAGLCGPSTRDTSCTGHTGRTGWRLRSVQPCEGPRDRRELLKCPTRNDRRLFETRATFF